MKKILTGICILMLIAVAAVYAGGVSDFDTGYIYDPMALKCVKVAAYQGGKLAPSVLEKRSCPVRSIDKERGVLIMGCDNEGDYWVYGKDFKTCMDFHNEIEIQRNENRDKEAEEDY